MRIRHFFTALAFFSMLITSAGYCEEYAAPGQGSPVWSGLSAGVPGFANAVLFWVPGGNKDFTVGIGGSVSLITLYANEQKSDQLFTSVQFNIPLYLLNRETYFIAIAPVAGLNTYNPSEGHKGRWYYGGAVVDACYKGLFAEAGIAFGPRTHIAAFGNDRCAALFSVGYLFGGTDNDSSSAED